MLFFFIEFRKLKLLYGSIDNFFIGKFNLYRDNFRRIISIYLLEIEIILVVGCFCNSVVGYMVRVVVEF